MRVYRVGPTIAVIAVFLLVSNFLLVQFNGGPAPKAGIPIDEAWLIFYALRLPKEPPETVDQEDLRTLLMEFDSDAEIIGSRFEVLSYSRKGHRFELRVRHIDGTVYRVSLGGVRIG
jgi:hypothetical protein